MFCIVSISCSIRVVGVDGVGDVVDDRVLLLGQVVDDLDRVAGHAGCRRPAVVTLERRVALGCEVVGDGDRAALGVAALVPLDLDALLLGVGEAQRVGDLTAARCRTRAGCARAGHGRRARPTSWRARRVAGASVAGAAASEVDATTSASSSSSSPPLVATSTPATMATTATIAAIGPHRRHARPPPDDCSPALAGCMCTYPCSLVGSLTFASLFRTVGSRHSTCRGMTRRPAGGRAPRRAAPWR